MEIDDLLGACGSSMTGNLAVTRSLQLMIYLGKAQFSQGAKKEPTTAIYREHDAEGRLLIKTGLSRRHTRIITSAGSISEDNTTST